jgi:hypothetical protein
LVGRGVTLEPIDEMHWPLIGLVLQRLMASGEAQDASFCAVAGSATTSGTGVAEVLRSVLLGAALTPAQLKPSTTLVGTNGASGVNAMTKLCELKFGGVPGIEIGVLVEPVSAFVAGFVAW